MKGRGRWKGGVGEEEGVGGGEGLGKRGEVGEREGVGGGRDGGFQVEGKGWRRGVGKWRGRIGVRWRGNMKGR